MGALITLLVEVVPFKRPKMVITESTLAIHYPEDEKARLKLKDISKVILDTHIPCLFIDNKMGEPLVYLIDRDDVCQWENYLRECLSNKGVLFEQVNLVG